MYHLLSNINGNLDSLLSNPHMNQNTILIIIYNMLYLQFIDSTWYGLLFICIFYFSITPCILKYKVSKPCYLWLLDQRENTIRGHKIGQCKGEGMLKSKVVDWFMWLSSTQSVVAFYIYTERDGLIPWEIEIPCKPCQNTTPNLDLSAKPSLAGSHLSILGLADLCGMNLSEVIIFLYGLQIRWYIYALWLTRQEKHNGGVYFVF